MLQAVKKSSNETKDFAVRVINISIFGCASFVALSSHTGVMNVKGNFGGGGGTLAVSSFAKTRKKMFVVRFATFDLGNSCGIEIELNKAVHTEI